MTSSVAIITGIGCAIARRLASQGWRLVLADRTVQGLADCRQQCEALGAALRCVEADVRHEPDVAALVAVAQAEFGGCQGFVSNAGIAGVVEATVDYPSEVFRQVLEVNTVGTFLCLKHALPLLRRTAGSFVAIASTSAIRGRANMSAYVASKHAVLGLVRSSALECLGSAVRVNAVLPGPTQTAMIDDVDRMAAQRSPQGQISRPVAAPYGKPEDVAHTVAFLLSSEARHINGAALVTDAGSIPWPESPITQRKHHEHESHDGADRAAGYCAT